VRARGVVRQSLALRKLVSPALKQGLTAASSGCILNAVQCGRSQPWEIFMTTNRRATLAALTFSAALAGAAPAHAFNCSVPEKPGGPIPLRAAPDLRAKVVVLMRPGGNIRLIRHGKRVGDDDYWALVRWTPGPDENAKAARGWALGSQTHGGECED
jgi:hypothetical protein